MKSSETNDTDANVSEQGAHVAPEKPASKKGTTQRRATPKRKAAAKEAKSSKGTSRGNKAELAAKSATPRPESKGAKILEMLGRAKGVTLIELMRATDWQAHSVRGFISTAGKKHDVTIESSKTDAGDRSYRIAK